MVDLNFDEVLGENEVSRRGACEESKDGVSGGPRRRDDRLDERHHPNDRGYERRLRDLDRDVDRGAEGAVRVRYIVVRMRVDCLDGAGGNDQGDTEERNKGSPKTCYGRFRPYCVHVGLNIAHAGRILASPRSRRGEEHCADCELVDFVTEEPILAFGAG